jgi:hypothetical protein
MHDMQATIMDIPHVHELLGCDFGTKVSHPGVDEEKCLNQAVGRVSLYDDDVQLPMMQFCRKHMDVIMSQSDQRS